jgi:branched-subunit amino acid transport protein
VVDEVALGQIFRRILRFSPVSVIAPLLHIDLCTFCRVNNGPVISGPISTETQSHSIVTIKIMDLLV